MLKKIRIEICILSILFLGLFIPSSFNVDLYSYFNNSYSPLQNIYLKKFFINITTLGNSLWYFSFSIIFFIILYFIKDIKKLSVYQNSFKKLIIANYLLFLSILISGVITQILKHLIGLPRPNTIILQNEIGIKFFTFDSSYHSFPSGHATTIFAVALICVVILPRLKYFFYTIAALVAFSRFVVGAHYITDIIAGICVAFIGYKLSIFFIEKTTSFNQKIESLTISTNKLLSVLIVTIFLALLLGVGPSFDIYFSNFFYLGKGEFLNQSYYNITILFREIVLNLILIYIFIMPIFSMFVPINKIYFGYKFKLIEILFIWMVTIFNLVILINLVLKNYWGRARPNDVLEFGGNAFFSPWYKISDNCITNCSLVSGDAAVGFSIIIFFFLIKNKIFFRLSLFFGFLLGLIRVSEGGHFLSDIILSFLVVFAFSFISYFYYSKKTNG